MHTASQRDDSHAQAWQDAQTWLQRVLKVATHPQASHLHAVLQQTEAWLRQHPPLLAPHGKRIEWLKLCLGKLSWQNDQLPVLSLKGGAQQTLLAAGERRLLALQSQLLHAWPTLCAQAPVRQLVGKLFWQLPVKNRLPWWLKDREQLGYNDIAYMLGCTVPTVVARVHRARLFCLSELDAWLRGGAR